MDENRVTEDVHAPKISPDDPRFRLPESKSRVLKKGPVIAVMAFIACAILSVLALALLDQSP